MGLAHEVSKSIGKVMVPLRAGDDGLASRKLEVLGKRTLDVTSAAFTDGGPLPLSFTAEGDGIAPPIAWHNVPGATRSIVVVAEDPDAPAPRPFVHWLVYGIPVSAMSIDAVHDYREGRNSMLRNGYTPASPPAGHGTHHYHFQVFALDVPIDLEPGAGRAMVLERMRNHVVGWGEIVATFERS